MSFKAPAPDAVYQSDNLYEVRFESAMKYLTAQLVTPESVHLLTMVEDKPTYTVEYNLGNRNPHAVPLAHVDDAMADRIVKAFHEVGWANCYWREFNECDHVIAHMGNWGYRFYFERPIETVPYEVLRRISKKVLGDLPSISEVSDAVAKEPQSMTVTELTQCINAQMPIRDQPRRLNGDLLAIIQCHLAKDYGYTGTGYYTGQSGELAVVLDLAAFQIYYCRRTRIVYRRDKLINSPWHQVDKEIVVAPIAILSALKDLEVFNASV
ncbi:hypothetical protein FDI21_gp046 [Pseudomonas phage Noxifer]|uniref:Uncharacterized protein n=1 Tax=Pseudomonas phage Noxifer TaxID=2006684 RepID=A0A1Y0T2X0_9CAUD|nr:hypothetical protein FDI21_gp046 [Pseudomonas phage Noxifer]ARV77217.1 hypothetical protein NOXIFER_46 [Pseudomonas phage Noxifer]